MQLRRALTVGAATAAILGFSATAALASSCANVSRAPAPCGTHCASGPVTRGNWVWLPSIGVPDPAWGFAPPGTPDSRLLGTPGANGNYTNGKTLSLLGVSAICTTGVPARQTTSGIQSGCA